MFKVLIQKASNFFSKNSASEQKLQIELMSQHIIVLQAQFKYLQQRLDKMEIPR